MLQEKGKKDEAWFVDPRTLKRSCFRVTADVQAALALLRVRRATVTKKILATILVTRACPKPKMIVIPPVEAPKVTTPENPEPRQTELPKPPEPVQLPPTVPSEPRELPTVSLVTKAQEFADIANARRRARNVPELIVHPALTTVAQAYADGTQKFERDTIQPLLKAQGYSMGRATAFTASGYTSAQDVFDGWATRRANTSPTDDSAMIDIGIGYVESMGGQSTQWAILLTESRVHEQEQELVEIAATLADRTAVFDEVLTRTNAARAACSSPTDHPLPRPEILCPDAEPECFSSLPPLTSNALLSLAAQGHTDDMKTRQFFGHQNPDGLSSGERVRNTGYRFQTTGENIAQGQGSAERVVNGWLKSCGHRKAILSPLWTEIGLGLSLATELLDEEKPLPIYWAQEFAKP